MDLKELQHEAFVFIGDKDEYAEIIPDGNIDKAAELVAEFVHHLWECGMEYTPDTGERQSNIPNISESLPCDDKIKLTDNGFGALEEALKNANGNVR